MTLTLKALLMNEQDINRATRRMAHEILERNNGASNLALVGVYTRGVPLARHLAQQLAEIEGIEPPVGQLDITMYRDDLSEVGLQPFVRRTDIPFDINGKTVVLCDDVLYTGRTTRAALDALLQLGRPAGIQLAVLVDRGHRELPIRPDYVGRHISTSREEVVKVKFHSVDGQESVELLER